MHYYSWSFVCVTFHVITWLLSSTVKIMSFMPIFRVLWSHHSMLYIVWSRLCWCISPKKLLFCYHLPTRGWAGVKLGDAWYVSNVSIIFDAPCLFYTICFFFYTSWRFYAFSGTNLLTRCHSVSSLFSVFLCFRKVTQEIFSNWTKREAQTSYFSRTRDDDQRRVGGGPGTSHTRRWRAPWPH
jgi:hypothetical protein